MAELAELLVFSKCFSYVNAKRTWAFYLHYNMGIRQVWLLIIRILAFYLRISVSYSDMIDME